VGGGPGAEGGYCEADWIAKEREWRRLNGEGDQGRYCEVVGAIVFLFFYSLLMENQIKELLELLI
jgi:hypothetical protein